MTFALLLLCAPPASAAGVPIAQVKTASGQVSVQRGGERIAVRPGDSLYEQDTVETGADGSIGITFTDNTVMSAGPNSELALAEYRFDSNQFNGAMLAEMRQGTLSVVSGDIARSSPDSMKVKTPTAILGIRGTRFVVQVKGD
jgi:hypothetical protein